MEGLFQAGPSIIPTETTPQVYFWRMRHGLIRALKSKNPSMVQVFSLAVNLVFARSVFLTQKPTIPVPIKVTERPLFPRHNYSVLAFAPESPLLSGSRPTRHPQRLFAK